MFTIYKHMYPHWRLAVLLVLAALLRLYIVAQGGQYSYPDEVQRIATSRAVWMALQSGDINTAVTAALALRGHTLFYVMAIPAVALDTVTAAHWGEGKGVALVLMWFSVANIALVYALVLRMRANRDEALLAAIFMSASFGMFYFARHLFPYDAALCFTLFALYIGWMPVFRWWRAILMGAALGVAVFVYNGIWMWAGVVVLMTMAARWTTPRGHPQSRVTYKALVGIGLGGGLVVAGVLALVLLGGHSPTSYLLEIAKFGRTVNQGDFAEGWSLIWEYLWVVECGILIILLVGVGLAVYRLLNEQNPQIRLHGMVWLIALIQLYGIYAVISTGFHIFVMYGRLARVLIPGLCVLAAFGYAPLVMRWQPAWRWLALGGIGLLAAMNFAPAMIQGFSADFEAQARTIAADFDVVPMATDTIEKRDAIMPEKRYVVYGTRYDALLRFYVPVPEGTILLAAPSIFQYEQYLYEGLDAEGRATIRAYDSRMRLIDTQP